MGRGFQFYCELCTITYDFDKGLSWTTNPGSRDNELVASEKSARDYLTEYGVKNIKSVKIVEAKVAEQHPLWGCDNMLQTFAEYAFEDEQHAAERFRKKLIKYCGVQIEYQR